MTEAQAAYYMLKGKMGDDPQFQAGEQEAKAVFEQHKEQLQNVDYALGFYLWLVKTMEEMIQE